MEGLEGGRTRQKRRVSEAATPVGLCSLKAETIVVEFIHDSTSFIKSVPGLGGPRNIGLKISSLYWGSDLLASSKAEFSC